MVNKCNPEQEEGKNKMAVSSAGYELRLEVGRLSERVAGLAKDLGEHVKYCARNYRDLQKVILVVGAAIIGLLVELLMHVYKL